MLQTLFWISLLFIDRLDGRMVYMKGGELPGVCTWMLFLPDEDLCVILLSNRRAGELFLLDR
jgi:hypothetical protein